MLLFLLFVLYWAWKLHLCLGLQDSFVEMQMCHNLQVYWSQNFSSVQHAAVSSRFQQEGVYHMWDSPGRTAWGRKMMHERWHPALQPKSRHVLKTTYWKMSISQRNAWETWFGYKWECAQIWRVVMSLLCPHGSLERVAPGTVQRRGKPAFSAMLGTWGSTTEGWESSTAIPTEHCTAPHCLAKWQDFCWWFALCVTMKNYWQLSLHSVHLPAEKTFFCLPVMLKTAGSSGWSSSPLSSCKRQECKLHVHVCSENSPSAWLRPQWSFLYHLPMICFQNCLDSAIITQTLTAPLFIIFFPE